MHTHQLKAYLLSISLLHATHRMHALDSVETTKVILVKTLQQKNPSMLPEFDVLFKRYEQIVFDFFDTNNHESLSAHIKHMEQELETLDRVCRDAQFSSIVPTLLIYQGHLKELVTLLKSYHRSLDIIPLGFKVRKFKFLLPTAIQQWGDFALFWALHHRVTCA
jgi:hypothetical protein